MNILIPTRYNEVIPLYIYCGFTMCVSFKSSPTPYETNSLTAPIRMMKKQTQKSQNYNF